MTSFTRSSAMHSFSETTPLLESSDSPKNGEQDQPRSEPSPGTSVISCSVFCILFCELCERLTFYGILSNMVLFVTSEDHLNMTATQGYILNTLFQGLCFTAPVLGGVVADSIAGKFRVILYSLFIYFVATLLIPVSSITRNPHERSWWVANSVTTNAIFQKTIYFVGLFLIVIGTGGIKANVGAFGADQVSVKGPMAVQRFFGWFFWFINIGAMVSFTFVAYTQQHVSYFYGNFIPAFSLFVAIIIFLLREGSYEKRPATSSAFSTIFKLIKEAAKRSKRPTLSDYCVNHWLDRAKMSFGGSYTSWEVEDVKMLFRIVPIFAALIPYNLVYSQMTSSMIYQGSYMNLQLVKNFSIPVASLAIFPIIAVLVFVPVMDNFVYPLLAKCNVKLSSVQRLGIGMFIAFASMAYAGWMEMYRVDHCCIKQDRHGKPTNVSSISVFYQVPQYTLIGLGEVFSALAGYEIAYTEAPKHLRSVAMGVYLLSLGLGSLSGILVVTVVNAITGASGSENKWYPDKRNINDGYQFAYYFFFLAGLMVINCIIYIFLARSFTRKKGRAGQEPDNEPASPASATDDVELSRSKSYSVYI